MNWDVLINPKELDIKLPNRPITSQISSVIFKTGSNRKKSRIRLRTYLKSEYFSRKYLPIYKISKFIAKLDFIKVMRTSIIYGYNKPNIDLSIDNSFIEAEGLKHPIIERIH